MGCLGSSSIAARSLAAITLPTSGLVVSSACGVVGSCGSLQLIVLCPIYPQDTSKPLAPGQSSQWWYISDTHVSTVPESRVLNCEAYLLFYERLH